MKSTKCKVVDRLLGGEPSYELAERYDGFATLKRINENVINFAGVVSTKSGLQYGFGTPIRGLKRFNLLMQEYAKAFPSADPTIDATKYVLKEAAKITKDIIGDIHINGKSLLLEKLGTKATPIFKVEEKHAVSYVTGKAGEKDRKLILSEIANFGAYYMGEIANAYFKELEKMRAMTNNKAVMNEYESERVKGGFKPYLNKWLYDLMQGTILNLHDSFKSDTALEHFVVHFSIGDVLRLFGEFNNAKMLEALPHVKPTKENFANFFSSNPDAVGLTNNMFDRFIKAYQGDLTAMGTATNRGRMNRVAKALYRESGDIGRFARSTLNFKAGTLILVQSMAGYMTRKYFVDAGSMKSLYSNEQLENVLDFLGYPKDKIFSAVSRHLSEAGGTTFDGHLTLVEKIGRLLSDVASGVTKDPVILEGIEASAKGLYNIADILFKRGEFLQAVADVLFAKGESSVASFLDWAKGSKYKNEIQESFKSMVDRAYYTRMGFFMNGVDNMTAMDGMPVSPLAYLSKRGFAQTRALFHHTIGNVMAITIDGVAGKNPHRKEDAVDYMKNDPRFLNTLRYLMWSTRLGHKLQMIADRDEVPEPSTMDKLLSSFGFGNIFNNFLQGIRSQWVSHIINAVADGATNPVLGTTQDKLLGAFTNGFKQLGMEFLRGWNGFGLAARYASALSEGVADDGRNAGADAAWTVLKNSTDGYARFMVDEVEGLMDKNNVPMSSNDSITLMLGKQTNDIKQLQTYSTNAYAVQEFKNDLSSWLKSSVLYALPFMRDIAKGASAYYDDLKNNTLQNVVNQTMSEGLRENYINKSLIPLNRTDDKLLDGKWQSAVGEQMYYMATPDVTSKKFDTVWSDVMVHNSQTSKNIGKGEEILYDYYRPLADLIIKSKMTPAEMGVATQLFAEKDLKKSAMYHFLQASMKEDPAVGSEILGRTYNKLLYSEAKAAGASSFATLSDDGKYTVQKKVNAILSPYIGLVSPDKYNIIMREYLNMNPNYDNLDKVLNPGDGSTSKEFTLAMDLDNSFRAYVNAAIVGVEKKDYSVLYSNNNIGSFIGKIKDKGIAAATLANICGLLQVANVDPLSKANLQAGVIRNNIDTTLTAAKDNNFYTNYTDAVNLAMTYQYGTKQAMQTVVDEFVGKDTKDVQTQALMEKLFGDSKNYSGYSKAISYYDKLWNYGENNYVKDFILKNYNGYSNQSYGSKYSSSYRDFVRAVAQLDYKQVPGRAESSRMIREFRSPQEMGLPGGSFTKQSGISKPYRVGTGVTPPKPKGK